MQHTINGRAAIAALRRRHCHFTLSLWLGADPVLFLWVLYLGCDMCIGPCHKVLRLVFVFLVYVFVFTCFLSPSSFVQGSPEVSGWLALNMTWREQEQKTPRHAGFDKQIISLLATMRLLKDFSGQRSLGLLAECWFCFALDRHFSDLRSFHV